MLIMNCDNCYREINYDKGEVYHATARVNHGGEHGEVNKHIHLCDKCYTKVFGSNIKAFTPNRVKHEPNNN